MAEYPDTAALCDMYGTAFGFPWKLTVLLLEIIQNASLKEKYEPFLNYLKIDLQAKLPPRILCVKYSDTTFGTWKIPKGWKEITRIIKAGKY